MRGLAPLRRRTWSCCRSAAISSKRSVLEAAATRFAANKATRLASNALLRPPSTATSTDGFGWELAALAMTAGCMSDLAINNAELPLVSYLVPDAGL